MTIVMIAGGFDLSVGAVLAMGGVAGGGASAMGLGCCDRPVQRLRALSPVHSAVRL